MSNRDILINLLMQADSSYYPRCAETVADYLIENGVSVCPLRIGDKVYSLGNKNRKHPREWSVVYIGYNGKDFFFNIYNHESNDKWMTFEITENEIGKLFFLTEKEAIEHKGRI